MLLKSPRKLGVVTLLLSLSSLPLALAQQGNLPPLVVTDVCPRIIPIHNVSDITLTISGSGFLDGNYVVFTDNNQTINLPATVVPNTQSTQLMTRIPVGLVNTTGTAKISVMPPFFGPPVLSTINPPRGVQGASVGVTISGTNLAGATLNLPRGVTATNVAVPGVDVTTGATAGSQITATFIIASDAPTGAQSVTVTTAGGSSNPLLFTIIPPAPTLTSIKPDTGTQGTSVDVTLAGTNLAGGTLDLPAGISAGNVVTTALQITATFAIAANAQTGAQNITVTTAGGRSNALQLTIVPPATSVLHGRGPRIVNAPMSTVTSHGATRLALDASLVPRTNFPVPTHCVPFPVGFIPFVKTDYLTAQRVYSLNGSFQDFLQDFLLVGQPVANVRAAMDAILPLPTEVNQKFCGLVQLAPDTAPVDAFVPTPEERTGVFNSSRFSQVLIDPFTKQPFPAAVIPIPRIDGTVIVTRIGQPLEAIYAWRLGAQPGASALLTVVPMPTITGVSPSATTEGAQIALTISGTDFIPASSCAGGSGVQVNGTAITNANTVSSTQITAAIPEGLAAGAYGITVTTPNGSPSLPFTLLINPKPVINSPAALPAALVGSTYGPVTVSATGGTPPFRWSITPGSGLIITPVSGATAIVSGTPARADLLTVSITAVDSANVPASATYQVRILPVSPLTLSADKTELTNSTDQPTVRISLGAGYPVTLSGQLSLTFEPDRANLKVNPDAADPDRQLLSTDQFPNPGFAVPAGSSGFSVPLQPGLGAGTVTVRATNLTADNLDVTPASPPAVQIKINAAPPSITACALVESASTFQTRITGFSSTREVTTASFTLTAAPGSSLTTGTVPVPDASSVLFAPYYATNFGAFTFTQIFNVQGSSSAVGTVSVTLGNALGTTTKACLRGQ